MPALGTPAGRALLLNAQRTYAQKVLAIAPASLVSYLPLWEASGSTALDLSGHGYNGAYTGVDLGQPGIGDGRTCPLYDGVNDLTNLYSAGLAGAFNGQEGTFAVWAKVRNIGVWTDGAYRTILNLKIDGNNQLEIYKEIASARISYFMRAGGVTLTPFVTGMSSIAFLHLALTWSKSANQVKAYLNGAQVDTTKTGLGTWAGALPPTGCYLGAETGGPATPWNGYLAHSAFWDTPLSAAQIAQLASLT